MVFAIVIPLLLIRAGVLLADDCTTGFSVVAPELAVPGKTTAVFLTLHGPASLQPLNVSIQFIPDADEKQKILEITQEIKGHGIIPLEVPLEATGSYHLKTLVSCTGNPANCELQSSSQVRLVGPVRDVIIRPAKHAYGPGETVSFWVLALDHDLQVASGSIGTVSVKDSAGTKVAVWDQVPLDEGVKSFSLPLSEYARFGKWLLHVEVESNEFWTPIEIAPSVGNGLPDVSAAEEHYVELRFGREMRRRYKPGLPFTGKVEAMSTEKSVRVRVKVYDNTTSIYSQDIEITNGEGTFTVPAILADSDVITLQAELVSVESKEIESHYVLAREPIQKWNSSSDCYLLIKGVEHTLQPDEEAHVDILSTCPCEQDLHYVITTDGQVTDWAQRRYEDPLPPSSRTSGSAAATVCKLNFSFNVRSIMAPVSQLLVYYVTAQGEPVSDVISFDVKLLQNQVYVNMEEREWWLPGQTLDLEVVAEPSSLVCLLGGRSETNGDIKFDPRISEEHDPLPITGEVDFLEAGVSFFQKQCLKRGKSGVSAVSYRQRGSGAGPSDRRRPPESLVGGAPFDQLWMWKCFNYTSKIASTGLTISAPEESGKWSLWALTISTDGLRFSQPVNVQVYRPLQAEFHLPPSLRVRETLEVDIKIGNNINSCMDVTALLALSEGAQFLSNGLLYVTERLRLGPRGATSLVVKLLVTTPGLKNMTVEVNGYTSPSCEGADKASNATLTGAVIRSATVKVYPEGIVRTDTESAYFCANENILISSADSFKYEWITAPRNHESVILEIKVGPAKKNGPLTIALAESRSPSEKMFRITLGDLDNKISWIGRGKHDYAIQLKSAQTPGILSADEWRSFWISWEKDTILFGKGSIARNNTLLRWKMNKKMKIQHLGFASSWGNMAAFRIWNFNDEAGFSQVLHLDTPRNVVPGSEWGELIIAGGLALPSNLYDENGTSNKKSTEGGSLTDALASLSSLIALRHLSEKSDLTRNYSLKNLPGNVQTLLSFRKPDNSFSEHQMMASHKTTLSILEVLIKVQAFFGVDPDLIQAIKRWVQLRQEDDGRFTPLPADVKLPSSFYNNMSAEQADNEYISEITAETVIILFDIGIENDVDSETLQKAKIFLENSLPNVQSPEAIAAVTLALVLVKSATSSWAMEKLRNASTTEDGEFGWPRFVTKRDAANWLYESEGQKINKEAVLTTINEYKASIHALNIFCITGDLKFAESVARYLFYRSHMLDSHPELLYPLTKAFTSYDSLTKDEHRSLTVSVATSGMELTDTISLKMDGNPQTLHLPSLPTKVFIYATGGGCATVQGKTTYSTYATKSDTKLLHIWSEIEQEMLPDKSSLEQIDEKSPLVKNHACFRWKYPRPSGVLRMEILLFSGYELITTSIQLLNPPESMAEMQHGYYGNKLWFIFANVSSSCPICVKFNAQSLFKISSLRPSYARIYPSGREDLAADTFFHTKSGSNLLKSITDDDLITWFGKNATEIEEINFPPGCAAPTTTTTTQKEVPSTFKPTEDVASTIITSTLKSTTIQADEDIKTTRKPLQKLEMLSVATYTINVDNESVSDTTFKNKDDTKESVKATTTENVQVTTMTKATTESTTLKHEDYAIQSNLIPDVELEKEVEIKAPLKEPIKKVQLKEIQLNLTEKPEDIIINGLIDSSKTTVLPTKRIHINTDLKDSPIKYFTTANPEVRFEPEIKNDKYVLLDKQEIWSLLKEIAGDAKLPEKTAKKIGT